MAEDIAPNPLVSHRAPEASLSIQLHPLVLLTISDYITRHTLRSQKGPVVGAVIGEQNGRSYTLEHAYECLLAPTYDNQGPLLDQDFFLERLEQYKDVHKSPQLDLVAMFMLGPADGPRPSHLPILKQVQKLVNSDGILLLLFHPETVDMLQGGKLPISIYEAFEEQVGEKMQTTFWDRNFEVETGEAEMIGVDFVAKGGGNASAIAGSTSVTEITSKESVAKGKGRILDDQSTPVNITMTSTGVLSAEDDELVASLTAKANAIRMLKQRLNMIQSYLSTIPQSQLTNASDQSPPPADTNFALLRSMQAMLSRLPLLAPQSTSSESTPSVQKSQPTQANAREHEDVHLTSLLATLTRSVVEAQALGSKFHEYAREKSGNERAAFSSKRGGPLMPGRETD